MIKNYIKHTARNLSKHKLYAVINLVGLTVGLSAALTIGLYSLYVLNYDRFHENADRIFMVYKDRITPNGIQETYDTWVPLLKEMQIDFPQIQAGTRVYDTESRILIDDNEFAEVVNLVDPDFFEIFTFPTLHGDHENPLPGLRSVVINYEMALKYFGRTNVTGEILRIVNRNFELDHEYVISAVLQKHPDNSYLNPAITINFESTPAYQEIENLWESSFITTYIMLKSANLRETMESTFPDFVEKTWDRRTRSNTNLKLLPFTDNYRTFVGDINNAYTLLYAALGILLMAIINFINLATARSMDRAKEIGMKKVLGAYKRHLRIQFLCESVCLSLVSLIMAMLLSIGFLPLINRLIGMELNLNAILDGPGMVLILVVGLLTGIIAGLYPAFYLSGIKTLSVLRGNRGSHSNSVFRNSLVTFQFTLATLLIIGTFVVNFQIRFMTHSEMGFDPGNLIVIPFNGRDFDDEQQQVNRIKTFQSEIRKLPFIESASLSRHIPTQWSGSFVFVRPKDWDGDPLRMRYTLLDGHFFNTYAIDLIAGKLFDPDLAGEQRNSVIINQAALEAFGWTDPSDKIIRIGGNDLNVIGVVRDFHFETLRNEIQPTLHLFRDHDYSGHRYLSLKINNNNRHNAQEFVSDLWSDINPSIPFNPIFIDQSTAQMYEEESRLLKLSGLFTGIGILIAALGLYGLASFVIEKRTREISIRKVVGATSKDILSLVLQNFTSLIAFGFVIGGVLASYFSRSWLEEFAYRILFPWEAYIIGLTIILLIVVLTVSYQTFKVALSNPVRFLRQE